MNNSTLTFLGKDSGFGENNNSAFLEIEDTLILIDCGFTVFNQIKNKFDFNKYKTIQIIITHLHNDHAGSLSQVILYLWFVYNKKVTVLSKCSRIKEYLEITGAPSEAYEIKKELDNLMFIKTEHVDTIDSYGFKLKINNKTILYTGDTSTLKPFADFFGEINEFYVDVSKNGGVHLKIEEVMSELKELEKKGINVYCMHVDDLEYVNNIYYNV